MNDSLFLPAHCVSSVISELTLSDASKLCPLVFAINLTGQLGVDAWLPKHFYASS